jgi:hypothetical protein
MGVDNTALNRDITQAKGNLMNLKKSVDTTSDSFDRMKKPIQGGSNTLMQFSRIAQDAPFGIMGIGNNITATAESFSYLSASSGGAGNALKAVASSMMGVGGILLAVSLVTSALTYMSQNGITVGDVFKKLTGDFDLYADALKKANEAAYKDEGVQSAIANVQELTINIGLAKDGFLDKEKVVEQYNETIGKTTGFVDDLDEAEQQIVKNGEAYIKMTLYKAAANLALQEAAKAQLKAEETRVKKLKDFAAVTDDLSSAAKMTTGMGDAPSVEDYKALKDQRAKAQKKRKDEEIKINQDAANANINIAKKFQEDAAKISKDFNFNLFGDNKKDKPDKPDKPDNTPRLEAFGDTGFIDPEKLRNDGKKVIKVFEESLGSELERFKSTTIPLDIPLQPESTSLSTGLADMLKLLDDFNEEAKNMIQGNVAETFSNLGVAIGEALSSGGNVFQAIGSTILQGIGNFLSDLGGMLIKYGTLAVVKGNLDIAILTGGPVSIAAGIAAIGVGIALKAAGSMLGKAASKGSSQGGNSVSTGGSYSSPSGGSYSSSNSGGGGSVVFEISGQSLIGVLSNTLDKNSRLGGSLSLSN